MTSYNYRLGSTTAVGQSLSWGSKITKKDPRKPNILTFSALKNSSLKLGDEIKYYDLDNTEVFAGYVQTIEDGEKIQTITVGDYSITLSQVRFSDIYEDMSPEAIVEDIITNYTELTYSSTVSTGVVIKKIVFDTEFVIDAVNKLLELINGNYSVDRDKVFTLKLISQNISSKNITRGRDAIQGNWKTDNGKQANKIIVIGDVIDQRTTETLSGTGTEFFTTYKPENIQISGLKQTTETITGDYLVDIDNSKITFNTSKTDPVVSYTYKSQIRVELGEGKTIVLEKKYIKSKLEARKLAQEYLLKFSDGVQSSKWLKSESAIDSYEVGDKILVTDDENNRTGFYNIKSVVLTLPKSMVIEVGEDEEDLFDFQKETIERIKQLEREKQNSDFLTIYDFLEENINIAISEELTKLETIEDSGTILWASDTTLATNSDLISDTGVDADYALAIDDGWIPVRYWVDYLNPTRWPELTTEEGLFSLTTEDEFIFVR